MANEIRWLLRYSTSLEVGGTCTNHHLYVPKRARDQTAVGQIRDSQGEINLFLPEMHHAIHEQ